MTDTKSTPDAFLADLTPLQATILEAYIALRRDAPAEIIGSIEIRRWLRAMDPGIEGDCDCHATSG